VTAEVVTTARKTGEIYSKDSQARYRFARIGGRGTATPEIAPVRAILEMHQSMVGRSNASLDHAAIFQKKIGSCRDLSKKKIDHAGGGSSMTTTFSSAAMNVPANAACLSWASWLISGGGSQGEDVGEHLLVQHVLTPASASLGKVGYKLA
jgi:hypothetical protein